MNDINEIKQALEDVNVLPWQYRELHRTIEYDTIQDANGKNIISIASYDQTNVDFLLLAVNNISSLITTIESQKEEIEQKDKFNVELAKQVLTLEQQISTFRAWQPNSWDSHLQIESLKAITELKNVEIEKLNELVTLQRTELIDLYAWRENQNG